MGTRFDLQEVMKKTLLMTFVLLTSGSTLRTFAVRASPAEPPARSERGVAETEGPLLVGPQSRAQAATSYTAWRAFQVEQAVRELESARRSLAEYNPADPHKVKDGSSNPQRIQDLRSRIEQAEANLALARELTFSDYLNIHVSAVKSRALDARIALNMAPSEVAELIGAYRRLRSLKTSTDDSHRSELSQTIQ